MYVCMYVRKSNYQQRHKTTHRPSCRMMTMTRHVVKVLKFCQTVNTDIVRRRHASVSPATWTARVRDWSWTTQDPSNMRTSSVAHWSESAHGNMSTHHDLVSTTINLAFSFMYQVKVSSVTQWQERRSWPANFPCRTLDLQLMGDHVCG